MSLAEDFNRIFAGLERSHGRYVVPPGAVPDNQGKLHDTSWARTVPGPLTVALWEKHLAGEAGLGVVPIRDDATCVFAGIDIDPHDEKGNYVPMDLVAFIAVVRKFKLPLVLCRTKSGGAHLYLFLSEPCSAALVRSKLMEWTILLGYPDAEIFPKQAKLASEKDCGSWINIPYCGGRRSTRYAIKPDGKAMTPEEFISAADKASITETELAAFVPPRDTSAGDWFTDGPPCLQTLAKKGFGDWQNSGLTDIAIYLKKRHGEGWSEHLEIYNQRFMVPPVPTDAVNAMIGSVSKKNYSYMCKQEPICGVCNRQVCLTRDYGVGGRGDDPGVVIGELVKLETEPPSYIIDVNAIRVECEVDDLLDQRRFRRLVAMKLNILIAFIKQPVWDEMMRERLARVTVQVVPEDATKEGQFWVHLQRFCTSKVRGRSIDELLMGKPFTEAGRTYFCSADFFQYLAQHRFAGATEKDVFRWLRKRGVEHHQKNLKGKFLNCWSVPSFPEQTEEHEVPRAPVPERM